MAANTMLNGQITDAVTQAGVEVLGDGPAMAMGNLYQAAGQALSNAAHNATTAQQNSNLVAQATTTQGVNMLYAVTTAVEGAVVDKINQSDFPEMLASDKASIAAFAPPKENITQ
jgi:Killing trait